MPACSTFISSILAMVALTKKLESGLLLTSSFTSLTTAFALSFTFCMAVSTLAVVLVESDVLVEVVALLQPVAATMPESNKMLSVVSFVFITFVFYKQPT